MKDRGIDALVNNCLTGPVLTLGSVFVAYLSLLLAYLYLEFTKPGYKQDSGAIHTRHHDLCFLNRTTSLPNPLNANRGWHWHFLCGNGQGPRCRR